jgi:hypothetical protein
VQVVHLCGTWAKCVVCTSHLLPQPQDNPFPHPWCTLSCACLQDLLAAEKDDLALQIEALKTRLEERGEEIEQLNSTNRRLLDTLEDADGSMGGLTTGLQVRPRISSHIVALHSCLCCFDGCTQCDRCCGLCG